MVAPAGGSEGVTTPQVHLQLLPTAEPGVLHLRLINTGTSPLAVLWEQSYYVDPQGQRRPAVPASPRAWWRPQDWLPAETPLAAGATLQTTVRPDGPPRYNPLTISRTASGEVTVSAAPRPLLPATGNRPEAGKAYEGQSFRFVLTLRHGREVVAYPFTFRITAVEVERRS
ncbi:MAG: hypothetical protein KatS3mg131_0497 [Candidatus Tectimicrobiota bacterium]|nr:MAG: hypothetical protein KatS3mg131_0497 [Candidatus Tectomicrobia bacterium]